MNKPSHATHHKQLMRLKRIEGQVRGLQKMIEDEKYCVDILQQSKAVRAALVGVEMLIMRRHIESCVVKVSKSGTAAEIDKRISEIINFIGSQKS